MREPYTNRSRMRGVVKSLVFLALLILRARVLYGRTHEISVL